MKYFGGGAWRSMATAALCLGGLVAAQPARSKAQNPAGANAAGLSRIPPQPAPQPRNPLRTCRGTPAKPAQQPATTASAAESAGKCSEEPNQPAPQLEAPKPAPRGAQPVTGDVTQAAIEFRGARRVPPKR